MKLHTIATAENTERVENMIVKNNQTIYFSMAHLTPEELNYLTNDVKTVKRIYHKRKAINLKCKIKDFFKRHRKGVTAILLSALLFISFLFLNRLAEAERGYKAIGGEVFIFFLPFIIVSLKNCICDLIDTLKRNK